MQRELYVRWMWTGSGDGSYVERRAVVRVPSLYDVVMALSLITLIWELWRLWRM